MDKFSFLKDELDRLESEGLLVKPRTVQGPLDAWVQVDGKNILNMSSNDYLGFANHPHLKQAAKEAIDNFGVGPAAVRTIAGTNQLHLELEKRLAEFKGAEATLSFPSGCACNLAVIASLMGETDTIFSDELNHASIIDGCRLSRAKTVRYRHCDPAALDSLLHEHRSGRRLIVTDGVFSMDGDIAPLKEISNLAREHGAMLYVDDAHGEGVLGEGGRGIVSHFKLDREDVQVEMGTFSKAFGVVGGHVSGSRDLVNFAFNKSRTWLLSGSHPPAVVAACVAAIDVLEKEPRHVRNLWSNTDYFRKGIQKLGFDTGRSQTPIVPVMMGDSAVAKRFSQRLFEEGIFALPIVFPMVAKDKARIRTIMNAALTQRDLDEALAAFENIGRELKLI